MLSTFSRRFSLIQNVARRALATSSIKDPSNPIFQCPIPKKLSPEYPLGGVLDFDHVPPAVAYDGTPEEEVYARSRETNDVYFRDNYIKIIERVGREVFPVILSIDNIEREKGRGGHFMFRKSLHETYWSMPVGPVYELLKNVSHISASLFSMVARYSNNPATRVWHAPVTQYVSALQATRDALDRARSVAVLDAGMRASDHLTHAQKQRTATLLDGYIGAMQQMLAKNDCSIPAIRVAMRPLTPLVVDNVQDSAAMQMVDMVAQLKAWRAMCTDEEWARLYCLVNVIWVVAVDSPREVALRRVMNPDRVSTQLIVCNGVGNAEDALTLLGRIYFDRWASRTVMADYETDALQRSLVHSLSSPRDLMADAAYDALEALEKDPKAVDPRNFQNPATFSGPFNPSRP